MNRRTFLQLAFGGAAAIALDVDKLVWAGPTKTYFIPTSRVWISTSDIVAAELARVLPRIREQFERDSLFYSEISRGSISLASAIMNIPLTVKDPL